MTTATTNIFNAIAFPSAEMRRQLYFHAVTGNDAVWSPFAMREDKAPGSKAETERRRKDEEFRSFVRVVLASQERVERFHIEIQELDQRRIRLLERIDEQIRLTEEKLQRLRDAAPEIEFPDGTRRKVFRDFDQVREESGALVSPDIIRAEAVSDNPENFLDNVRFKNDLARLSAARDRVQRTSEETNDALRRADKGEMSDKDMDEFKADMERRFAAEEKLLGPDRKFEPTPKEKTFHSNVSPTADFMAAVEAASDFPDLVSGDVKPQGAGASRPAPR